MINAWRSAGHGGHLNIGLLLCSLEATGSKGTSIGLINCVNMSLVADYSLSSFCGALARSSLRRLVSPSLTLRD